MMAHMFSSDDFTLDCRTCVAANTTACEDCIVNHLLANDAGPIDFVPIGQERRPRPTPSGWSICSPRRASWTTIPSSFPTPPSNRSTFRSWCGDGSYDAAMTDGDDDTVPTGRAGVDPLIAYPLESTGETGQIERPGDHTPWWFIPGMFAVGLGFIGLLVFINDRRADDAVVTPEVACGRSVGAGDPDGPRRRPCRRPIRHPTRPNRPLPRSRPPLDPRIAELPPAGSVRIGPDDYPITARCEVHLPFEPVDTDTQLSSYFFLDGAGERGLVERVVDPSGDAATRLVSGTLTSTVEVAEVGDAGAFIASFVGADVVVNPVTDDDTQCGDRVVTNEPAQFAEPHTRIVLDVCVTTDGAAGTTISGLTSEGSRFEILQAGGELAEIVFERAAGDVLRTSAPATILRTGPQLSASGVVSNGTDDLDITIDIGTTSTVDSARACTAADRL